MLEQFWKWEIIFIKFYSHSNGPSLFERNWFSRISRTASFKLVWRYLLNLKKDLFKIEFKHSIFFFSLMRLLSPLYISLTVSISSDTINNLALVSLISRLLFHNYSSGRYTAFSLNSGLFGSILLVGIRRRVRPL